MTAIHELAAPADLGPALIGQVAAGDGVTIGPGLARSVDERRAQVLAALAGGEPVYGVTTGLGALSGIRLTEAQQRDHQRNLLLARATGGPPWLPARDARAVLAVRLATFLTGDAGVSAALCQRLADALNADLIPAIPAAAAGTAGEIVGLAHAFGPLTGIGHFLGRPGQEAALRPAAEALAEHGMAEFALGPKEGIALIEGVPGATALSLLGSAEGATTAAMLEAAAGLSIAAIGAPADPYDAACARGDDVHGAVLVRLRALLGDQETGLRPPRMLQAPVSFRVAGPVAAHVARASCALDLAVGRALAGVTDSPAFLGGRFTGTAGFHGIDLAGHCDQLTAAFAHAAEVSAARTHRLLDPRVTGLAAQLAPRPGPDAGLVTVHKRAAGEVHALRRLAQPSAIGLIETSGGQEDVQSFAWAAAQALRAALGHARVIAACELLTAWQAAALAGGSGPGGAAEVARRVSALIAPITADRPFGEDIERLAGGAWLPEAAVCGPVRPPAPVHNAERDGTDRRPRR